MPKPIIGVTIFRGPGPGEGLYQMVANPYIEALLEAGALPILLPVGLEEDDRKQILPMLSGVLFTGGGDVQPELFGGIPHPTVSGVDARRDEIEIGLVRQVVETGAPFLGICRGLQVINVALGGSLYTDVLDQLPGADRHDYHHTHPRSHLAHPVRLEPNSKLANILASGASVEVNSLHHQGIQRLADGLRPVAFAPDGLVEAYELPNHPYGLAVQWHPEWLTAHASMRALFRSFVRAAESQPV